MQYKFAKEQPDYSDFTSGRVFYSLPGHPAFPVRLASEIFQRCIASRERIYKDSTRCTLYDPCCGAAYHLSVLAYLHGEHIQEVIGSDIDGKAVAAAKRNLGLLSIAGLDQRIDEISNLFDRYEKESHKAALASGYTLKDRLSDLAQDHTLATKVFEANALNRETIIQNIQTKSVDVVFTDVPYGQNSQWHGSRSDEGLNPLRSMLNALFEVLSPSSIVAIVSDKQQKASHKSYQRVEQFQIGKRRVMILKPIYSPRA